MIFILCTAAFNIMEYWIFILLLQYVCAADMNLCRKNLITASSLSALLITAASFGANTASDSDPAFTAMFLTVLLTIILLAKRKFHALLRLFPAFAIYFTLTVIPAAMIEVLFPSIFEMHESGSYYRYVLAVIIDVIFLIGLIALEHTVKKHRITVYFRTKETLGCFALLFFTFINGQLMALMNHQYHPLTLHYIYVAIFSCAFIFSVAYYIYSLAEKWRRIHHQTKARIETEYMSLQLSALKDTKENEEQVRYMRHDLNKHLSVIKTLCDEGKYEDVCKYIENLNTESMNFENRQPTGNEIADLVIGAKKKISEEHGIEFTFEGILTDMGNMSAPDICALLSNAYDNALESCMTQTKAYIRTKVSNTRNYTVIQIVNSVDKKITIRKNSIPTSKKDKISHGYGMEIMKQIAGRYNGSCTFTCSANEFCVKIILLT